MKAYHTSQLSTLSSQLSSCPQKAAELQFQVQSSEPPPTPPRGESWVTSQAGKLIMHYALWIIHYYCMLFELFELFLLNTNWQKWPKIFHKFFDSNRQVSPPRGSWWGALTLSYQLSVLSYLVAHRFSQISKIYLSEKRESGSPLARERFKRRSIVYTPTLRLLNLEPWIFGAASTERSLLQLCRDSLASLAYP